MDKDFEKRFAGFRHATTNLGKAKAYVDYVQSYQEEHNEERILAAERHYARNRQYTSSYLLLTFTSLRTLLFISKEMTCLPCLSVISL